MQSVHPYLRGVEIQAARIQAMRAAGLHRFQYENAKDSILRAVVYEYERVLYKEIQMNSPVSEAFSLLLDCKPFDVEFDASSGKVTIYPEKTIYACWNCDCISYPTPPVFPTSRICNPPDDWETDTKKGYVRFLCPRCASSSPNHPDHSPISD